MSAYRIPKSELQLSETIKRSRFIATAGHTDSETAAKTYVAEIRSRFADATHHCYAYLAGPPGSTARVGMSDDGEPHGTAGRPILNVLLHSDVGEITIVVTRYFGGTKLGTGGLVSAYSGMAQKICSALDTKKKQVAALFEVDLGYRHVGPLKRIIDLFEAKILKETYGEQVGLLIAFPQERTVALRTSLLDATGGEIVIRDVCGRDN